jgi:hypothetical protein
VTRIDPQPIGDIVDARGVRASMHPDDLVADIVVIMRVITPDGPAVRQVWSTGMDWISRRGLIEVARDQEVTGPGDVM